MVKGAFGIVPLGNAPFANGKLRCRCLWAKCVCMEKYQNTSLHNLISFFFADSGMRTSQSCSKKRPPLKRAKMNYKWHQINIHKFLPKKVRLFLRSTTFQSSLINCVVRDKIKQKLGPQSLLAVKNKNIQPNQHEKQLTSELSKRRPGKHYFCTIILIFFTLTNLPEKY